MSPVCRGNLTTAQIVDQVLHASRVVASMQQHACEDSISDVHQSVITNIVFMGECLAEYVDPWPFTPPHLLQSK